ncbi:MAG: type II toxin-antitoxin system ParD family antitoxin [Bacteroidota bacterium]
MNVSLTPQLEALVREKVASGLYTSASEVVREALRLLAERDDERSTYLARLRADVQRGLDELDRGEGTAWDLDTLFGSS